jgi:amidase
MHYSGGSSGGSGAAVAAGLLPLAQGSDGAGSIRIPAAFCGLYGIKPSRGRVANAYGLDDRELIYTDGPLARSVDDAAALLDVMAGVSVGRPHWAPPPEKPFAELCRIDPPRLRIKLLTRTHVAAVDPEVEQCVRSAARALEAMGHTVEEAQPPEGSIEEFLPIWQHLIAGTPVLGWSRVQPVTRWLGQAGKKLRGRDVRELRLRLAQRVVDWSGDADLLLTPTTPSPAPRVGAFSGEPREVFYSAAPIGAFTAPANLTGQPAASLPLGVSKAGLPIGVQVVGRALADATVLAVSRQLEQALPWRDRRAPLWDATG